VILVTAVALVGGVLAAVLALTVDDTPAAEQEAQEAADVVVLRCRDSQGAMTARARVTNHSSEVSDYYVDVEFTRGESPYVVDTASGVVEDLAPGDSTPLSLVSSRPSPPTFDCRVGDVDRLSG
jgi:hypothetical protein